jgi:hypothetical protein
MGPGTVMNVLNNIQCHELNGETPFFMARTSAFARGRQSDLHRHGLPFGNLTLEGSKSWLLVEDTVAMPQAKDIEAKLLRSKSNPDRVLEVVREYGLRCQLIEIHSDGPNTIIVGVGVWHFVLTPEMQFGAHFYTRPWTDRQVTAATRFNEICPLDWKRQFKGWPSLKADNARFLGKCKKDIEDAATGAAGLHSSLRQHRAAGMPTSSVKQQGAATDHH